MSDYIHGLETAKRNLTAKLKRQQEQLLATEAQLKVLTEQLDFAYKAKK